MTAAAPRRVFVVGDPDVKPYPLLNSLVVPRPIAWISTLSEDGGPFRNYGNPWWRKDAAAPGK